MSTPIEEPNEPSYSLPKYNVTQQNSHGRSSEEDNTMVGESDGSYEQREEKEKEETEQSQESSRQRQRGYSHLTVQTEYEPGDPLRSLNSPSQTREQAHRLDDDLAMLKVERQVSKKAEQEALDREKSGDSAYRSRSRPEDHVDDFDVATNPVHEKTAIYKPPEHPTSAFAKFMKRVHTSNFLVRYFTYITPVALILLLPLLLGALVFKNATVGGVYLVWFMIWLEIVWLTLWAGRILAKCLPWPIGLMSTLITNNSKKWRDMGKQLELPATLFFWWLGIEVSFLPTMIHHQIDTTDTQPWMATMNKVLVALFVGAILNFVEKIIIQLIAISFHLRTYADRIEINKFQIGSLTKLYTFSKDKIAMEDSEFEQPSAPGSGAITPGLLMTEAQKTTKEVFSKFGDIAGKVAGDFTGHQVTNSTHPHQVILALLSSTQGSQVLARRLYRTFAREDTQTVHSDDLRNAFDNDDEADAAFTMFDKDMNGDISMEELEAVCVEIGRERKSITASLKDLDSVVSKLDSVFLFIVLIITLLVFISLISTSAAGVLTSAGSTVLALSWLFSATAQEFLQSVIFVFVKHPFDVGDRVGIYGNTGALGRGDDYFVKEISLLYTEFKKMEGHVVQAPNNYLNTLFILNQRRSGGLAEAVSITIKFGTTLDQIEGLRNRLLEFVRQEKREYQANILTELRDIVEAHQINLNVVFFYKSNWQNEGLRLARRNKFICAMMVSMQELGIEGPRMRYPGQKQSFPVYLQNVPHVDVPGSGHGGHPVNPVGISHGDEPQDPPFVAPLEDNGGGGSQTSMGRNRSTSILRGPSTRARGESLSAMNKRVDFSLGMRGIASGDLSGDVYQDRSRPRLPVELTAPSPTDRARASSDTARMSQDAARSTSHEFASSILNRTSTDAGGHFRGTHSVHRNRFFNRGSNLRPGTADDHGLLEQGMADIPEIPSTADSGENPQSGSNGRLDSRSGLVSSAAWRANANHSNTRGAPQASGALEVPDGHRVMGRSQTENLEMRRWR